MMSQVLRNFPHIALTCAGMLLFIAVFVGALAWVFRRGSDKFYREASLLPLDIQIQRPEKEARKA